MVLARHCSKAEYVGAHLDLGCQVLSDSVGQLDLALQPGTLLILPPCQLALLVCRCLKLLPQALQLPLMTLL